MLLVVSGVAVVVMIAVAQLGASLAASVKLPIDVRECKRTENVPKMLNGHCKGVT
jgi:hypothetical protein